MQPGDSEEVDASKPRTISARRSWLITFAVIGLSAVLTVLLWQSLRKSPNRTVEPSSRPAETKPLDSIRIEPGSPALLQIKTVPVGRGVVGMELPIPAVVEPNQQELQQITPLVSGRISKINVALGDFVKAGTVVLSFDSPQVAEMHGKLHEAQTRLKLAKSNLDRVKQSANKVSVLKAKATLEEAEATLKRITQLVSEGLAPKKDLVAAQAQYERADADFNFQKNISLNREVAEAQGELKTAETEVEHIKDGLQAMDARLETDESGGNDHDISRIEMHAPISGTIVERFVNPGAGFESGKPLLTIANTSTVWIIANVPDRQVGQIYQGMPAVIKTGSQSIPASVNYIDPRLNEDTRTARVRLQIANPNDRMKVGSFVQVEFQLPSDRSTLSVPSDAVQNLDGKSIVFVERGVGNYLVKRVIVGESRGKIVSVKSGLEPSERVVSEGAFLLKSQLLKSSIGDD